MVRLRTRRTAIFLYGVLLVLPTAILGALQWRFLTAEHQDELELQPTRARHLAARVRSVIGDELRAVLDAEERRSFDHWARFRVVPQAGGPVALVESPDVSDDPPRGVLAWFAFEASAEEVEPQVFWSAGVSASRRRQLREPLLAAVQAIRARTREQDSGLMAAELSSGATTQVNAAQVAASRARTPEDLDCVRAHLDVLARYQMEVRLGDLRLRFFRDATGEPFLYATRLVTQSGSLPPKTCRDDLVRDALVVQGLFLDPDWFFQRLPAQVTSDLLDNFQHYSPPGAGLCCPDQPSTHVAVRPLVDFKITPWDGADADYGRFYVGLDATGVDARFARQRMRFFALAGMLGLTLATGLGLLLRSVSRDLEQARRTEDFVAAVTHELRTPLSGIKLHAEMLLDGWAPEDQRDEYYRRIVRETDRLSTLVERVLEKGRLASTPARPVPGDLNAVVEEVVGALAGDLGARPGDLAFEPAPDLPLVMLTAESIRSILVNLVENARKYAPVDPADAGAEPILVRTRRDGGEVLLEVLDRGPGIDPKEAGHVFEAFYRLGTEATRTTRGTGLGLHLVALQAEAIGARVAVEPRSGGGSAFRVRLRRAPEA